MNCPQCDRPMAFNGIISSGKQRYRCRHKDCSGKDKSGTGLSKGRPAKSEGKCPYCSSEDTKKNGRYCICKKCGKSFKF